MNEAWDYAKQSSFVRFAKEELVIVAFRNLRVDDTLLRDLRARFLRSNSVDCSLGEEMELFEF